MCKYAIKVVTIAAAIVACSWPISCGMFSPLPGTGTLKLMVTDKPFPVDMITEAAIKITRIEMRKAGGDPSAAFVTIFDGERMVDLLDLRNGRMDLLAEADIPAGSYDQMRLIVTDGKISLTDGREFDLKVPSGEETGIKLNFNVEIAEGEDNVLLLDVDLTRAFSAIPSGHIDDVSTIRSFQFHPSLAMRLIRMLEAGKIIGTITDDTPAPIAAAQVAAFDEDDTEVSSTMTETDGTFVLMGLHTGTYRVDITADGFEAMTIMDVNVTAEETTDLGTIVLTASP
jgi:hypothetical protein